jgi:hypothetical protein
MNHISAYYRYLSIPPGYGPFCDGLRWARNGDAIETADGKTFILTAALPPFLEGFESQRSLIHFAHILDLLDLLGHRDAPWDGIPRRACMAIRDAFRSEGTPLRNAGTFFGTLCKDFPPAYIPSSNVPDLTKWLASRPSLLHVPGWQNPEQPQLDRSVFHRLISESLQKIDEETIRHWFRFGRGPLLDEGKRLAEEIVDVKPPAYQGTLDDLLRQRPRLVGALPLVGTMVSALTMPPRRRTPPELPLGGYADVTNRGDPERLLPSQFALDADDFVRRFAEKELLFFRKEEPHQRTREQLTLLVDQGVRTWGVVRLALSAAVLAFRKLAERKKLPFRVRFGSAPAEQFEMYSSRSARGHFLSRSERSTLKPEQFDPSDCDLQSLVDLLESSDLALNPAEMVAAQMNQIDSQDVDIVLLTHPRNLRNKEVQSAAASLPENNRLFALTVDDKGAAQFSQLRHGEEVAISRFRVNFRNTEIPPVPRVTDASMWKGDVEPVPFPFPIEPFRKITAMGFDADSNYLLVATHKGYLFLYSLVNAKLETLPRGCHSDEILFDVQAVLGMQCGFAVCGQLEKGLAVVHYDLATRMVKLYRLGPITRSTNWYGFPEVNAVAVRDVAVCRGLDLVSGAIYAEPEHTESVSASAQGAYLMALEHESPPPFLQVVPLGKCPSIPRSAKRVRFLAHDKAAGTLTLHYFGHNTVLCPIADGRKLLQDVDIHTALGSLFALAICCEQPTNRKQWFLIDIADSANIKEISGSGDGWLSPDGFCFAQLRKTNELVVHTFAESGKPVIMTGRAHMRTQQSRFHNNLRVLLGETGMQIIVGRMRHMLSWKEGPLQHTFDRMARDQPSQPGFEEARRDLNHRLVQLDAVRFTGVVSWAVDVLIDATGQVIVHDFYRDRLVCIFCPRREKLAAWMPDGTRYGPSDMIGGPAAPDAMARLGAALRQASLPVET